MSDDTRKAAQNRATIAAPIGVPAFDDRETATIGIGAAQTIEPLVPPRSAYFDDNWSPHLSAPRHAYVTATQCNGYRIVPLIDLDAEGAADRVREQMEALRLERLMAEAPAGADPFDGLGHESLVSDDEVEAEVLRLRRRQMAESAVVRRFYATAYPEGTLVDLRVMLASDRWLTGGRWLAVSRDKNGRPARYSWLPADQMRFTVQSARPAIFRRLVRDGIASLRVVTYQRYPRLIVQLRSGRRVVRYYREWGDTRLVDALSGRVYASQAEFDRARVIARSSSQPEPQLATEVLFSGFAHPAAAPYGRPLWWSSRLKVENSTRSDQVVNQYFDDPTPRVLLLVSGGGIGSPQAVGSSIEEQASGVRNHGKIVIIEGIKQDPKLLSENPTAAGGAVQIDKLDLGTGVPDDMFTQLDEANEQTIGAATLTPPLVRGRDKDVNRASATEQRRAYETYLVGPERRRSWDDEQNELVLPELGVCTVRIESLGPSANTDAEINEELRGAVDVGILSPNDARPRYRLGEPFAVIPPSADAPWPSTPHKYVSALVKGVAHVPGQDIAIMTTDVDADEDDAEPEDDDERADDERAE